MIEKVPDILSQFSITFDFVGSIKNPSNDVLSMVSLHLFYL